MNHQDTHIRSTEKLIDSHLRIKEGTGVEQLPDGGAERFRRQAQISVSPYPKQSRSEFSANPASVEIGARAGIRQVRTRIEFSAGTGLRKHFQ